MGQEIDHTGFDAGEFARFAARLEAETRLLGQWWSEHRFADDRYVVGFELEAWLLDGGCRPAADNQDFLRRLDDPMVVPELSRFNVELNGCARAPHGDGIRRLEQELERLWQRCLEAARARQETLAMIGILPVIRESDLSVANISPLNRYYALNEQIFRQRGGCPMRIDIEGRDRLHLVHQDVMLEAATTSFQVHFQVPARLAVAHFNAALAVSAAMVAIGANSPYLFEHDLWDETRIPLFEQSVDCGVGDSPPRVTFGPGYLLDSPVEWFRDNLERYPALLPIDTDGDAASMSSLRLHNGTIWRWNRPLVDFDEAGRPHLRIEHRPLPAGPTIADMFANLAFFVGLDHALATDYPDLPARLPFESARRNFYAAARSGLAAPVAWLDGTSGELGTLIRNELLPRARRGLDLLGVDAQDARRYLGIVQQRASAGRRGSDWQRAFVAAHSCDFHELTTGYLARQLSGVPVHRWTV